MSVKNLVRSEPVGPTTPVKFILLSSGGETSHCVNVTFIVSVSMAADGNGIVIKLANGQSLYSTQSIDEVAARLMNNRLLV